MNDRLLHALAVRWLQDGREAIVVEVQQARGSAPRDAGARMLVAADGVHGTIGGGHLELQALGTARAMLRDGVRAPQSAPFALGPSLGQCCGGHVVLRWRALDTQLIAEWTLPPPLFHLQLHGAGHVGTEIAALLARLDVTVDWIDEREAPFPAEPSPPHIRRVAVDAVEDEVALAPPGSCYVVLTHSHDLDLRLVERILRRGDARFCGLIGSATKRERFLRRLSERGLEADRLAQLTCPIGIEGIDGKAPEVIAVAVVAQLLRA